MKIHTLQTGTVAIKSRQPRGLGRGRRRLLNTLVDREWTAPLPINAFAIEHPEGLIVVDTGETSRAAEPGYYPPWHPFFRFGLRVRVTPDEEIGPRLEQAGLDPADVRWLVLTHMHTDHAGGLAHFPRAQILVSRTEYDHATGPAGRLRGYMNHRFPSWFDPAFIRLTQSPLGPFPESMPLTAAGDVTLVPLPGHTPGQVGVVVQETERRVLLAGDASYTESLMLEGAIDGVAPDESAARRTLARIQQFVTEAPTVYAVAHDPETAARVSERRPSPPPA